jgi:serine/threonine-protein kinase
MNKPATLDEAVDLVRKSRLVEEDRLSSYLDTLHEEWPLDPAADDLLHGMVRAGLLTRFQASLIGNGRWMGFEIGNYRILDRLGEGGSGQVFLAEHAKLGHRVALKVLDRRTASPLALERFLREARAAAKLCHPNIIRVDDINPNHDPPYIIMEYADGITAQAAVARHGPFDPRDAAAVAMQIAHGLAEAHAQGLIHRDVKPANILIDRRGIARLLDLGIVRVDGENLTGDYAKHVILGTIDYLSPEQSRDSSNIDHRADLYSLGATMHFLMAGESPVPVGSLRERLRQLQSVEVLRLDRLRADCPTGLAEIVQKLLAKNPDQRFATASEVAEALSPFAKPRPQFPACIFKHQRSTLSDANGAPTPPGGTPLPRTEAIAVVASAPSPKRQSAAVVMIAAFLFGLAAFALYMLS